MMPREISWYICIIVALLIVGCAGLHRENAVPESLTLQATIPGFSGIRYRLGIDDQAIIEESLKLIQLEQAYLKANKRNNQNPPVFFLAISGGGDNGAFGAGLLNGWTAAGNRPEFKVVTGVSTGALIAPFAFLGPAYDNRLKELYTNTSPKDIMERRSMLAVVASDAMANNRPLWERIEREIDQAVLDAIVAEYLKGRILVIVTVDLDARQSILWNMTKIAASKTPKALDLFRTIMIASAAIPGTFPPVMIDVVADGEVYQEMHVDGGTMSQVFIYPSSVRLRKEAGIRSRTAYVIRNSKLEPQWANVDRRTMSIAFRAVTSLIHTQGIGDLYQIYLTCQRDGVDFNLAAIPASFKVHRREEFDTEYMRALFNLGYEMAAQNYPWQKKPPGYKK